MKSRSSRPKSGSKLKAEHLEAFLQDGASVVISSVEDESAANHLTGLGLISIQSKEYVRCANPEDRDFPPKNRHCRGRVIIPNAPSTGTLRCPECERAVYPDQYAKRRYTQSHAQVLPKAVIHFIAGLLGRHAVEEPGVFRVATDGRDVTVCIVEYAHSKYLARERAVQIPTCFIAISPVDVDERFLGEPWVRRATLAEIVAEPDCLPALVRQVASEGAPAQVLSASIPVCEPGPISAIVEATRTPNEPRSFVVEVGDNVVRVNGLQVVARQSGTRFLLFRAIWERFLEDLRDGLAPELFRPTPVSDLRQEMEARENPGEAIDELRIRRAINRLQSDVEAKIKEELGLPIGREDIVETCRKAGQADTEFGYRLNPRTVLVRPYQAELSH